MDQRAGPGAIGADRRHVRSFTLRLRIAGTTTYRMPAEGGSGALQRARALSVPTAISRLD